MASSWPPLLADVKTEMRIDSTDTRDDDVLQTTLDAAIAYVEAQRAGDFNFSGTATTLPDPRDDIWLGTVRLVVRWHTLRRSPDGLVDAGEFGTVRVPNVPADIERLLGIGNFRRPLVG